MAAAVDEAQRPMSVEEELKNFRATWDAPDPTRPPDVEIVMPEADLEDWPRLDRAHCAAARDAERISGRTLIDEEEDLEDPSCVPNPYEFEDAAEAELREVFPLRTILCGARAIRPDELSFRGLPCHIERLVCDGVAHELGAHAQHISPEAVDGLAAVLQDALSRHSLDNTVHQSRPREDLHCASGPLLARHAAMLAMLAYPGRRIAPARTPYGGRRGAHPRLPDYVNFAGAG